MSLLIVEGPDGAGKSTLISQIACDFNYSVYFSGRPDSSEVMRTMLDEMIELSNRDEVYICDRAPWISELIYSEALRGGKLFLPKENFIECYSIPQRIIYCSLSDSDTMLKQMSKVYKAHKPAEHTESVAKNYQKIHESYERIMDDVEMLGIDLFRYNWQESMYPELKDWI